MNIELKKAEDAFKHGLTFFLTGKAGTGKSFFLKSIIKDNAKKCIVLAPTGMAAINVNGQTIHSFFKFPINPLLDPVLDTYQFEEDDDKFKLIKEIDCIIIDEISMVRADLLDAIDHSLKINGGNETPFGGKQMIFIGDLMQLPPIITKTMQQHYFQVYDSLYFLSAEVFKTFPLRSIELKHVYRQQTDNDFLCFLNEIRDQSISQTMLDYINKRVGLQPDKDIHAIRLMTNNNLADEYNKKRLDELNGKLWLFKPEIEGDVSPEQRKNFKEALALKIDAQVSFNKNDMQGRYFNGSIGKLTQVTDDELTIELDNGIEIETGKYQYELFDYGYDITKKRVTKNTIGTITQFPIQLAWAITIHKSQGQTYENAVIDMGSGAFTVGQTYVAFSRVKSYEGLYLTRKLYPWDIIKDVGLLQKVKNIINLDCTDHFSKSFTSLIKFNSNEHQAALDDSLFFSDFSKDLAKYYRGTGDAPSIGSLVEEINTQILPQFLSGKYGIEDVLETIQDPTNADAINLAFAKLKRTRAQINLKAKRPNEPYATDRKFDLIDELIKDLNIKQTQSLASIPEENDQAIKIKENLDSSNIAHTIQCPYCNSNLKTDILSFLKSEKKFNAYHYPICPVCHKEMKVSVDIESDDHRVEPISRQEEEDLEERLQEMLMNGEIEVDNGDEDYELTEDDIEYAQLSGSDIDMQPKPDKQFYAYQTAPKAIKDIIDHIIDIKESDFDMLIMMNEIHDGDYTTSSAEFTYPDVKFDAVVHNGSIKFLKFYCDLWECSKNV